MQAAWTWFMSWSPETYLVVMLLFVTVCLLLAIKLAWPVVEVTEVKERRSRSRWR